MNKIFVVFLWSGIQTISMVQAQPKSPVNAAAGAETKALYANLWKHLGKGVLFGHQDDLAYGVGWSYEAGESDVKKLAGDYPALYGWELGNLELGHDKNLDKVPFETMKKFIAQGYKQGSVISISWHANNPLTGKNAWDPQPGSVASILPGGTKNQIFRDWLAKVADFLADLKDEKGNPIPVLFRPWHELTGNWFWWCQNVCTTAEFKQLWIMTYDYLVKERKLNNLLWVYNTSDFKSKEHFMERYPGNGYVDLISFDTYQSENQVTSAGNSFVENTGKCLGMLNELADSLNKIPALAETGFEAIPKADWWTKDLLPLLEKYKVSYVLLWRNAGKMPGKDKLHYYVPVEGDKSSKDFKVFAGNSLIWFAGDVKKKGLYNTR